MSASDDAQRCDFCRIGQVMRQNQQIAFRQWTNKGYVHCQAEVSIGVCNHCGARHWNEDAEAIIEDAVRREYDKLP
ncbi:MAG TPA: hypothetical protein VH934_08345 [Xanthobacteraceae bacterium]|jgi:hypothetical protein